MSGREKIDPVWLVVLILNVIVAGGFAYFVALFAEMIRAAF